MHLEQLEYIVEVAKTGSITNAARNLHVSLSAVSQSITHLENELGVVLFKRSRQGAVPTAQGKEIIRIAFEVLSKRDELKEAARGWADTLSGELRMGAIPGPMSLLVDAVAGFKKDYPLVQMEIAEKGSQEILDDIRHHRLDLGFVILFESLLETSEGLSFERLLKGKMVVGMSSRSPLAIRQRVTPAELRSQPVVLYDDEYVQWFMNKFAAEYGPVDVLFTTNNTDAIRKAVRDHNAVTVGMDYSFRGDPSYYADMEIMTAELEFAVNQPVYLGWVRSEGRHFSRIAKTFVEQLRKQFE
ncbi:LysR family transcriptional regulator [Paenibacillus lutrae]|uniref:LysR family transcriptional regulator n=1 Tax=Paenibacillus lutrae TaxID=2078573 RepID=A0A7X3K0V0_9BACL|nr:LysR family transcriptional regulator [Paenibacillus lutrae]MVP01341.1 LysR family transcriptional regulator [Paenibacillus lutrae]